MNETDTNADTTGSVSGQQAFSTEEVEQMAAASEQEAGAVASVDQAVNDQAEAGEGVTVKRAFTMKNFLPATGYQDWIMQNVCARGAGTHVLVGRVYGMVYEAEDKETLWGNKGQEKLIRSIALAGDLQAQALDGRTITFDLLYLPMAFASRIARALRAGARQVELDVDIGLEATGKAIPYEWTVTSYLSGRAERALRQMANSRRIGAASPAVKPLAIAAENPTIEGDQIVPAETEKVTARRHRAA